MNLNCRALSPASFLPYRGGLLHFDVERGAVYAQLIGHEPYGLRTLHLTNTLMSPDQHYLRALLPLVWLRVKSYDFLSLAKLCRDDIAELWKEAVKVCIALVDNSALGRTLTI